MRMLRDYWLYAKNEWKRDIVWSVGAIYKKFRWDVPHKCERNGMATTTDWTVVALGMQPQSIENKLHERMRQQQEHTN